MSDGHVESCFGSSICSKSVLHLAEVALGTRVAGHEDDGADGDVSLQQAVGGDDGANGVCVQVKGEFVKGTAPLNQRYISAKVHTICIALTETRKDVQLGGSLRGLAWFLWCCYAWPLNFTFGYRKTPAFSTT
jgi:hypothetical protein